MLNLSQTINKNVYIAITDWNTMHQTAILDHNGSEIGFYDTGVIPTDFEIWNTCIVNGDYNQDSQVNIIDIVVIVDIIITNQNVDLCSVDLDYNQSLDILDIMLILNIILSQ